MGKTRPSAKNYLRDLTPPLPAEHGGPNSAKFPAELHHTDDFRPNEGVDRRVQRGPAEYPRGPPQSSPHRLYRPKRLAELLDVNLSTLWRWRQRGVLPPPVKIGGIVGWTETQVAKLLQERDEAF